MHAEIEAIFAQNTASIQALNRSDSTGYSADAARGHDHPASIAARRIRIADAEADKKLARNGMALAHDLLRRYARSEQDAVGTLNALAYGLNSPVVKSTDIESLVMSLDVMSQTIEGES